jgi:hypothetical protein
MRGSLHFPRRLPLVEAAIKRGNTLYTTSSSPMLRIGGLLLAACLVPMIAFSLALADPPTFTRLKESAAGVDGGLSRGVSWGDFQGDGWPDLLIGNTINQPDFLYRNNGDGKFSQIHEVPVTLSAGWTEGIVWVDIDNDGDLDVFAARGESIAMYRNSGETGLTAVETNWWPDIEIEVTEGCWGDYDADGDLDVYLAVRDGKADRLYRNDGDWRFTLVEEGPWMVNRGDARTCAWGDADGDGDLDLFVGNFLEKIDGENRKARNRLYRNDGDGRFSEVGDKPFLDLPALTYGASWVDYDDDADLDLFVSNIARSDRNILFENRGNLDFIAREDLAIAQESQGPSKGHTWGDFDNDGDIDLFVANGTEGTDEIEDYGIENFFYLNRGNATFERVRQGALVTDLNISAGTAWSDYDRDGDLDILVANWGDSDEDNALYRNDGPCGNWIILEPQGHHSNRQGIGARFELVIQTGDEVHRQFRWQLPKTGYGSSNEPIIHFGLGEALEANELQVTWPSGTVDVHKSVSANKRYIAIEGKTLMVAEQSTGEK